MTLIWSEICQKNTRLLVYFSGVFSFCTWFMTYIVTFLQHVFFNGLTGEDSENYLKIKKCSYSAYY